ncbi:MAG TPA: PfkB family carbohydrate kinase [Armatimonadota bacterium]|jgi:D-beta-D-heptose 7-phosphate kinase/D-beta-D-heptose 1-phosphate adenosyltransferase
MSDAPAAAQKLAALSARLAAFAGKRLLVIGDLMLDEYVWGQVNRISPEAPVMVVDVTSTTYCLGGAGNVASNVQAMGGHAIVCGVVGDDPMGRVVADQLSSAGGSTDGVIVATDRPTTVKTRIVAHSQQVVRVDREKRIPLSGEALERLTACAAAAIPTVDAVILSDYAKGALADSLVRAAVATARAHGKPIAANLKPPRVDPFAGAAFLTLNLSEAERAANEPIASEADLLRIGAALRERLSCGALLITRGADGVALFTDGAPLLLPTRRVEVYDVAGAGDAVISAAAMALAAGASFAEAAVIGNLAGNAKVTKLGVAAVTRDEIRRLAEMPS